MHNYILLLLLLIFTVITLSNCSSINLSTAKYHADIIHKKIPDSYSRLCGAGIIHRRFVLTLSRCFNDKNPKFLLVRAGGVKPAPKDQPYLDTRENKSIAKIYHSRDEVDNDGHLAVVKIVGMFDLSDLSSYQKVYLPIWNLSYWNKTVTLTSYKYTCKKRLQFTDEFDTLKSIETKVISKDVCKAKQNGIDITNNDLCTESSFNSRSKCYDYPGSPLVYKNQIIGLLNIANCDPGRKILVYSRVSKYIPFIKKVTYGFNIF